MHPATVVIGFERFELFLEIAEIPIEEVIEIFSAKAKPVHRLNATTNFPQQPTACYFPAHIEFKLTKLSNADNGHNAAFNGVRLMAPVNRSLTS